MNIHAQTKVSDGKAIVVQLLQQALHETQVETAKAQIYHWNVTGMSFMPLHGLFQEMYEDHFSAQDVLAERLRAIGHRVDGRLARAMSQAKITECNGEKSDIEMLAALAEDQIYLSTVMKAIVGAAEGNGDSVSADLAIERAASHDKFAWMLRSHLTESR